MSTNENALTVAEAAAIIGCTADEVRRLIDTGQLKAHFKNVAPNPKRKRWRILPRDLEAFILARANRGQIMARIRRPRRTPAGGASSVREYLAAAK